MYSVNQVIKDNCTKIFAQNNCWVTNSKVNVQMISRPVADHSSVCQGSRSPPTISPTPWKPLFPFVTFFFVSLLLICHSPALPITYCLLPRLLTLIVFACAQTLCKGSDVTSSRPICKLTAKLFLTSRQTHLRMCKAAESAAKEKWFMKRGHKSVLKRGSHSAMMEIWLQFRELLHSGSGTLLGNPSSPLSHFLSACHWSPQYRSPLHAYSEAALTVGSIFSRICVSPNWDFSLFYFFLEPLRLPRHLRLCAAKSTLFTTSQ